MTLADRLSTALAAVTLLPLRILAVLFFLTLYWAIGHLCFLASCHRAPRGVSRWVLAAVGQAVARLGLFLLGFYYIRTSGKRAPMTEASTLVANHMSFFDVLVFMATDFPSFVAKAGSLTVPFIGFLTRCYDCIYVHSKSSGPHAAAAAAANAAGSRRDAEQGAGNASGSATDAIRARQQQLTACGGKGMSPLLVFAEGTTTNGSAIMPLRTGAFTAGVAVQPVVLRYHYTRFSCSWETVPVTAYVFRLCTQWIQHAEIHYLPVYYPSPAEKADPALYARNVGRAMAAAAGLPLLGDPASAADSAGHVTAAHTDADTALVLPPAAVEAEKWALHRAIRAGQLHWQYWRNGTAAGGGGGGQAEAAVSAASDAEEGGKSST